MAVVFVKRYSCVEDRVFMVTGGAAGIGAGIVRGLLEANARHVAFLDILESAGSSLESELLRKFGALRAKFIICDVSNEAQLAEAYKTLLDKYRRLDGVINNAAVLSVDEHLYKNMIDINFTAVVNSTTKALHIMGKDQGGGGGIVLNISALLSNNIDPRLAVYGATKTALLHYSIVMGAEEKYSKTGVSVVTLCLGATDTALLNRRHSENFTVTSSAHDIVYPAAVKQRVGSAVTGVLEVIANAKSGSTWIVKNDKPAYECTKQIGEAFKLLSES